MTRKLFVKPAIEGSIVRQPDRDMRQLDPAGEWVVDNSFWRLRLLHGDVVEADPPPSDGATVVITKPAAVGMSVLQSSAFGSAPATPEPSA